MKLLDKQTIVKPSVISFSLDNAGWYLLSVSVRVKARKQRGNGKTDDEDLRLELDGRVFPKLDNSQSYLSSPAAFSGSQQQNTLKTVYFVIHLSAGKHTISLIPDEEAVIEKAEINQIDAFPHFQLELNQQAEKANGRPWMTFVLINLSLKSFTVKATVHWQFPDGDDIKIILDGKIKQNPLSILHRNWIFASNILRKLFGIETLEKTFADDLPTKELHYLEFWADESPTIHYIDFNFELDGESKPEIQVYKPGPQGEDYNRFNKNIANAVREWNEIFLAQKYPPPQPLDPNLVKAMIYIESRMGYGASSTGHPAYPDVMQVADERNPAIHTLNNDGWIDPATGKVARESEWVGDHEEVIDYKRKANGNTPQESIRWGVRWLYHKAQGILEKGGRYWRSWKEAVADYNKNNNWDYQRKVYKIYQEGIDPKGTKLWSFLLILFTTASLLSGILLYANQGKFYVYRKSIPGTDDFQFYMSTLDGLQIKRFPLSRFYANGAEFFTFYKAETQLQPLWFSSDSKRNKIMAVIGTDIAKFEIVSIVGYINGRFKVFPKIDEYGGSQNTFYGDEVIIKNLDDDPEEEIVERSLIRYSNADDQIWQSVYDFDEASGVYRFKIQEKLVAFK